MPRLSSLVGMKEISSSNDQMLSTVRWRNGIRKRKIPGDDAGGVYFVGFLVVSGAAETAIMHWTSVILGATLMPIT